MGPQVLLANLRALLERAPDLEKFSPTSREHMVWLSQAYALVSRWNKLEAVQLKNACDFLSMSQTRDMNITQIFGILNRAVADLEREVPPENEVSFAAGDVYDFFKALNKVIATAETSILIIDPYLDESVFDHYLNSRNKNVHVRLLVKEKAERLIPPKEKYIKQFGAVLEIR